MSGTVDAKRVRDLMRLFETLKVLHEQLLTLMDSKLDAMKRADVAAMCLCGEQEQAILKRLHEREGFRAQLMDVIGEELGMNSRTARAVAVSQLAPRLAEPERTELLASADQLRAMVLRVRQANRVVGVVSREILNHLRWVFAAVRPKDEKPTCYSDEGVLVSPTGMAIFETVG